MIARISSGKTPGGAVYYNEQKVKTGEATRLAIRNFEGLDVPLHQLTGLAIAGGLTDRTALNTRIRNPTFHVSLALGKGERVAPEDLVAIADQYMQGMGYSRQPYAIYQHHDTEHPHIHVVTVRIDERGRKISDQYEREKSNRLRQGIEKAFGLQVAEEAPLRPAKTNLKPVEYGRDDLRTAVSAVVQGILRDYTFSSFSQYNQLLNRYNVGATEVIGEGRRGITYTVLNADGQPVGPALKASRLPYRPTLAVVERRIQAGQKIKGDRVGGVRRRIEPVRQQSTTWETYRHGLGEAQIELIPHVGQDGMLFGLSYLDTAQRTLYTGSEVGKAFTAGSLKTDFGAEKPTEHPTVRVGEGERQQPLSVPDTNVPDASAHWQRLIHAIGDETDESSEHDLKRMLRKSRKPRLS
jgi:hypothetical protein